MTLPQERFRDVQSLYLRRSAVEVATHFGADGSTHQFNAPEESYFGSPGLVIHEAQGSRLLQSMTWGFPLRLKTIKPSCKPKPVNKIGDMRKSMWVDLARKPQWWCLIPLTEFAEAEGEKGSKTRTWFSLKDQPIFAWAGLWRESLEWGPVYSGVMTDCNEAIRPVHDRMQVLLHANEYAQWLNGSFNEIIGFQERCFPDELIAMRRTSDPWLKRTPTVNLLSD